MNRRFCNSILDTHTFCKTHVESDHELYRCLHCLLKDQGKTYAEHRSEKQETSGLPVGSKDMFKTTLHASLHSQTTENKDVEEVWRKLKSALNEGQETHPELPRR